VKESKSMHGTWRVTPFYYVNLCQNHWNGVYSEYMYFCKILLDEYWYPKGKRNFFNKMPAYKDSYGLGQSENMFSITYSKKLLEEVLKYVDKEKKRNLHTVFP
jgi:hypothetical protein